MTVADLISFIVDYEVSLEAEVFVEIGAYPLEYLSGPLSLIHYKNDILIVGAEEEECESN